MSAKSLDPDSPYYTSAQAAAYLRLSDDVLYRWRKDHVGPPWVQFVARRYHYPKDELHEWAKQQKPSTQPKAKRRKLKLA